MKLVKRNLTKEDLYHIERYFEEKRKVFGDLADDVLFDVVDQLIADSREYIEQTTKNVRTNVYLLSRLREFGVTFDDVMRDLSPQ
ncbi:hypothetical protein [Bacillus litorisediminis]|uniref:hypothetical protein n=1 Tax=Bacillus litorisediminis TaxID=2922713 RepID=UPI001FACE384|nr:hypothetical protein [Bacillus litorisediminis]